MGIIMAKKGNSFQSALKGKKIPILTLDNKWYQLFEQTERSASIRKNEQELNELLQRQGHLTTERKSIKQLKKKLMQEIVELMEDESASADKKMEDNKRLIEDCNDKLDAYEDELLELPEKIEKVNYALMAETMEMCYHQLHENATVIEEISKWITSVRIELKKKMVRKQERETESQQLYAYMHDIFGADIIEIFDMQYMSVPKDPKKRSRQAGGRRRT